MNLQMDLQLKRCARLAAHLRASATVNEPAVSIKASAAATVFGDPSNPNGTALRATALFGVAGKVVLVTGGTKGIGKMIARGFVENGAKVYIASRKGELCASVAAELNALGAPGSAVGIAANLSSDDACAALAAAVDAAEPGGLHVLVNNAGATWGAPYEQYPDAAWQKVMDLNVRAVFNLTKHCTPALARAATAADPARVINISSVDGVRAQQTNGPTAAFAYTVSKGAVNHLTHALCRALSDQSIIVNCIAPGVFPSNMTSFYLGSDEGRAMARKSNPLGKFGQTSDAAGVAIFLASPASAHVNGVIIPVDGGAVVHDNGL